MTLAERRRYLMMNLKSKNLFDANAFLTKENWIYVGGSHSFPLNLEIGKLYTISMAIHLIGTLAFCLCRKTDMSAWAYTQLYQFNTSVGDKHYDFVANGDECLWVYKDNSTVLQTISLATSVLDEVTSNIRIEKVG